MSVLMPYFWPCFAIGLVVGVIIGVFAFHKWPTRKRNVALGIGAVVAVCLALVWHGPLGAADRFTATVEKTARTGLKAPAVRPWPAPRRSGRGRPCAARRCGGP